MNKKDLLRGAVIGALVTWVVGGDKTAQPPTPAPPRQWQGPWWWEEFGKDILKIILALLAFIFWLSM